MRIESTRLRGGPPVKLTEVARPESAAKAVFDLERDVTQEDWEGLQTALEKCRGKAWNSFFGCATTMALVAPQRKEELGLNEEAWRQFNGIKNLMSYTFPFFEAVAILFPERRDELQIMQHVGPILQNILRGEKQPEGSFKRTMQLDAAVEILLVDPKHPELRQLPDDFLKLLAEDLTKERRSLEPDEEKLYTGLDTCYRVKLLFGDSAPADFQPTEVELKRGVENLNLTRERNDYLQFASTVKTLILASARRIWIAEDGTLQIERVPSSIQSGPSMPDRVLT